MSANKDRTFVRGFMTEAGKPKPKRQKILLACNPCKLKKIKCDGERPVCGPCSRNKRAQQPCVYREADAKSAAPSTKFTSELTEAGRLQSPLREQEPTIEDIDPVSLFSSGAAPSMKLPFSETRNRVSASSLPIQAPTRASSVSMRSDGSGDDGSFLPSENMIGASTGASLARQINDSVAGNNYSHRSSKSNTPWKTDGILRRVPLNVSGADFDEAKFVLPCRNIAERLFQVYWDYIDPIFPLLDKQTMETVFSSLWSGKEANLINRRAFHCLLNLTFALACSYGQFEKTESLRHQSAIFYDRASDLMTFNLMDIYHFEIVQIMLLTALYLQTTDLPRRCFQSIDLAIHVAQELCLHNPDILNSVTNSYDRSIARNVWLGCIIVDKIAVMTFGSVPRVSQDVSKASLYPSYPIETRPSLPFGQRDTNAPGFYVSYARIHHVLGKVLETFYDTNHGSLGQKGSGTMSTDILAKLFEIETDLYDWESSLSQSLREPYGNGTRAASALLQRQSNILHARYLCTQLLLFRPFFFQNACSGINNALTTTKQPQERVLSSFTEMCQLKCTFAARDLIEFIFNNLDSSNIMSSSHSLPSHWYIISYIYMAATVVLASRLFSGILEQLPEARLDLLLTQAIQVLESCQSRTKVALKCRTALETLDGRVKSYCQTSKVFPSAFDCPEGSEGGSEGIAGISLEYPTTEPRVPTSEEFSWLQEYPFDWTNPSWSFLLVNNIDIF